MRRLPAIVLLALTLGRTGYPQVVRALCGDGMLEPELELCDDGSANGTNACCTTECDFVDGDHDGICDAQDPCVGSSPLLTDVALTVKGFATAAPDDTFRLTAMLAPGGPVDLASTGFSVVLSNQWWGSFAHAAIPSGPVWRPRPRGGWSYHDATGSIGGITNVTMKARGEGTLALRVEGRRRDYTPSTEVRPVRVTVALAAAAASPAQCGETTLSLPRCTFTQAGNTLRCEPPAPQRRCPTDLDGAIVCNAKNAAAAEDMYFTVHGEYYSGECGGLPGFTLSADVHCLAVGVVSQYTIVTVSSLSSLVCIYSSNPHSGDPSLICQ